MRPHFLTPAAVFSVVVAASACQGSDAVSDAERAWLQSATSTLTGVDTSGDRSDLARLGTIVGNARVLAIGEPTHGNREFVRWNVRLAEFAAKDLGVTVYVREESPVVAARVNQYVHGGGGTAMEAMRGGYPMLQSREWLDAIEWMRSYNANGGRLEFAGFDIAEPQFAIDSVLAYLRRVDQHFVATATTAYTDIAAAWREEDWTRSDSGFAAWRRGSDEVHARLISRMAENSRASDTAQAGLAIHYANLIRQAARYISNDRKGIPGADEVLRDSVMAENVLWLLRRHGNSTRIVLSSHNLHVSRAPHRMGALLSVHLGNALRVIGSTTWEGAWSRNVGPGRPLAQIRWETAELQRGPQTSIEGLLHARGLPFQLVDLRRAATDSAGRFLMQARPARVNIDFAPHPVASYFDALVFIDKTTPVHHVP